MTIDDAWAIGLFEGEGTIYIHPRYHSVKLACKMTDHDVLKRLQRIWGGHITEMKVPSSKPHWKPVWDWHMGAQKEVAALLWKILPLLGERRACKALDALDWLDRIDKPANHIPKGKPNKRV